MPNLGPGTLTVGPVGSAIDISCQINNARIATEKDQDDSRTKLCGTVTPGKVTYTYNLSGNMDTDTETAAGIFAFSQLNAGSIQDFSFIPHTATGTKAVGKLMIDPLDFGADEFGAPLDSDFEWSLVGAPTYTYGTGVSKGSAAPGTTYAAEATVTAQDATNAAKLAGLGYVAVPTTNWTTGQAITVGTFKFNWTGTAWAAGIHA